MISGRVNRVPKSLTLRSSSNYLNECHPARYCKRDLIVFFQFVSFSFTSNLTHRNA